MLEEHPLLQACCLASVYLVLAGLKNRWDPFLIIEKNSTKTQLLVHRNVFPRNSSLFFSIISFLSSRRIFGYFSHLLKSKQRNPNRTKTKKRKKENMHCTEARRHTATRIPQSQIHFNIVIDVNIDVNLALRVYVLASHYSTG